MSWELLGLRAIITSVTSMLLAVAGCSEEHGAGLAVTQSAEGSQEQGGPSASTEQDPSGAVVVPRDPAGRPLRTVVPGSPDNGSDGNENDQQSLFELVENYVERDYQYVIEADISYEPGTMDYENPDGVSGLPVTIHTIHSVILDTRKVKTLYHDQLFIRRDCDDTGLCGYDTPLPVYISWGHVLLTAHEGCEAVDGKAHVVVDQALPIEGDTIYGLWGEDYPWDEIKAAALADVAGHGNIPEGGRQCSGTNNTADEENDGDSDD